MRKILNKIYKTIMALLVVLCVLLVVLRLFGLSVIFVKGGSMTPTIQDGEMYLMTKVDFENIKRGDIIVAMLPGGTRVTKRVIGLPGEHICIGYSSIWVDSDWIAEPYLEWPGWNDFGEFDASFTLGPDEFYLMGDNRWGGTWCGIVTSEQIIGKVIGK